MKPPSYPVAVSRIVDFSLRNMLRSRRAIVIAMVAVAPLLLAIAGRLMDAAPSADRLWVLFLRVCVPVLGVLYGTSLIADEVDDKTITYLFTRPVPRGAVVIGKYLAYFLCTVLVVLPSIAVLHLPAELGDLWTVWLGLAVYGALFTLVGTVLKRPLVTGFVFVLGWEQLALVLPDHVRRLTIAHYLQALSPTSVICLVAVLIGCVTLAARVVERREYVLEP